VHAQLNLPDFSLAVINTTQTDRRRLVLRSRLVSLDSRLLGERVDHLDASANAATTLAPLTELTHALVREGLVLVKLTLTDADGALLSQNIYWQGPHRSRSAAAQRTEAAVDRDDGARSRVGHRVAGNRPS